VLTLAASGGVDIPRFFLALATILVAAKLLGELAERVGQPAVLGELVAGVVLGGSVLGVVPDAGVPGELIHVLAELGVLLLLFEIGLETDLKEMFRVGSASLAVAVVGVVVPFGLGFAYWAYLPHPATGEGDLTTAAIFVGATLTATSVGITARVLSDLGRMTTREARVIIGAAVIDDVLGLVILSVVSGVAAGAAITTLGVLRTLAVAVGFLVAAVLVGRFLVPRLFDLIVRMRVRYVLPVFAIAFALGLSSLAAVAGSALIIGAFAAGIILSGTNQFDTIEHEVRPIASIFTPIFFVSVGASVDLRLLDPTSPAARGTLAVAGVLVVIAIVGKLVAGWAAPWVPMRRLVVGVGMVPRGEVGLIFADIGLRTGILTESVFGAVLLMVMVTTFVAPPGLKALFGSTGAGAG
jgi:Kef-type K+ transport system membrane component KefB